MTQSLGKGQRLLVTQKLVLLNDSQNKNSVEFSETLKYVFPHTFRSDISSENIQRIHVLSRGRALTVIDGKTSDESESRYDRYKDLLLFRSREMLQEKLSHLGVDPEVSSLGRFDGKPAYVLGAQYPDETVPQVWLDKKTFRPLRWIITSQTEQRLEVRYLEWQNLEKTWYPMRIEFIADGNLVREIHVENIKVNPSFSKKLFDIEHLKSRHPRVESTASPVQDTKESTNEIQKTIEDFKKIYE
jgi:outer membrane lipoprotein-sorting protein